MSSLMLISLLFGILFPSGQLLSLLYTILTKNKVLLSIMKIIGGMDSYMSIFLIMHVPSPPSVSLVDSLAEMNLWTLLWTTGHNLSSWHFHNHCCFIYILSSHQHNGKFWWVSADVCLVHHPVYRHQPM